MSLPQVHSTITALKLVESIAVSVLNEKGEVGRLKTGSFGWEFGSGYSVQYPHFLFSHLSVIELWFQIPFHFPSCRSSISHWGDVVSWVVHVPHCWYKFPLFYLYCCDNVASFNMYKYWTQMKDRTIDLSALLLNSFSTFTNIQKPLEVILWKSDSGDFSEQVFLSSTRST